MSSNSTTESDSEVVTVSNTAPNAGTVFDEAKSETTPVAATTTTAAAATAVGNSALNDTIARIDDQIALAQELAAVDPDDEDLFDLPQPLEFDEKLLMNLDVPPALNPFLDEYRKLQHALRKSQESEQRFVRKCQDLVRTISTTSEQIATLSKTHTEDCRTQQMIEKDLNSNRSTRDAATQEINERRSATEALRAEIVTLDEHVKNSTRELEVEQQNRLAAAEVRHSTLQTTLAMERDHVQYARQQNMQLHEKHADMLEMMRKAQEEVQKVKDSIQGVEEEVNSEKRMKASLDEQMKEAQSLVSERSTHVHMKRNLIEKAHSDLNASKEQYANATRVVAEHSQRYDELSDTARTLNEIVDATQAENNTVVDQQNVIHDELTADQNAVAQAKTDTIKWKKQLKTLQSMTKDIEQELRNMEEQKAELTNRTSLLKQQRVNLQFKVTNNTKQLDTCLREREVLHQNHRAKLDAVQKKELVLRMTKASLKNIKNEYQALLVSIRNYSKLVDMLRRDRAAHEAELSRRQLQRAKAEEEASQRDIHIAETQKTILLDESKLRQQQNILENVRSNRNFYCQTLAEQRAEMKNYKAKFHRLTLQIKNLKREIAEKDISFVTEHIYLEHVKHDIQSLKTHNDAVSNRIEESDLQSKQHSQQIIKLNSIIQAAEEEIQLQQKQFAAVRQEERVLNTQLVKRNDELAKLYEELQLQDTLLKQHADQYKDVVRDAFKLQAAKQQLIEMSQSIAVDESKFDDLKAAIAGHQRLLLDEQLRINALSEELKSSINVHRWRQLMDTDSEAFELIKKTQTLQKAIIKKHSEVERKEDVIRKQEKLYVDLRQILARQPGAEAAEQLQLYAKALRDKREKLKMMKNELEMYQSKVKNYSGDIGDLKQELQMLKLDYFARRRQQESGGDTGRVLDTESEAIWNDLTATHDMTVTDALDTKRSVQSYTTDNTALYTTDATLTQRTFDATYELTARSGKEASGGAGVDSEDNTVDVDDTIG
jgi:cilia- and flagella-associated protein 58